MYAKAPEPTKEQTIVNKKLQDDRFWNEVEKLVGKNDQSGSVNCAQYCRSITQHSQLAILVANWKGKLPYNSFSKDPKNPWVFESYPINNRQFVDTIQEYWNSEANVPTEWNICPFRVYKWEEDKLQPCQLEVDTANTCVRVTVRDQKIWCHPPRSFSVLENNLKEYFNPDYLQRKGNLGRAIENYQNVDTNNRIPEGNKPQRKMDLKAIIRERFNELYILVGRLPWKDKEKLTSYRYPTLQMEASRTYTNASGEHGANRFGDDTSGMHARNANAVHYQFADDIKPIEKPTPELFWEWVTKSPNSAPKYGDLFGG